jgi:hypothetical protein
VVAIRPDRPPDLREDVVGALVGGNAERPVALRVPGGEALRVGREAVHADPLRGGADEGVPALEDLRGLAVEQLVAGGDVVPADHRGAVEPSRVGGAVDEQPRGERLRTLGLGLPVPVATPLGALDLAVGGGVTGEEELLLDVAVLGEVDHRSAEGPTVVATGDGSLDHGSPRLDGRRCRPHQLDRWPPAGKACQTRSMQRPDAQDRRSAQAVEITIAVLLGGLVAVVPSVVLWLVGRFADLGGPGWDAARQAVQWVTIAVGAAVAVWWLLRAHRRGL